SFPTLSSTYERIESVNSKFSPRILYLIIESTLTALVLNLHCFAGAGQSSFKNRPFFISNLIIIYNRLQVNQ
ncbi:hypothetical protein, partial [Enterobacter hormaechei]